MREASRVVVCLALSACLLSAQDKGIDPDGISGKWGTNGLTMLELKADRTGIVSGTIYYYQGASRYPASIRSGAFDSTSQTLKLEGEVVVDGAARPYTIDATLDQGRLRANYAFGTDTGSVTFSKMATSG